MTLPLIGFIAGALTLFAMEAFLTEIGDYRRNRQSRKQDNIDSIFDSPHVRKEAGDERSYNKYLDDTQKEPERKWSIRSQYGRDIHEELFVEAICPHGVGHHKGAHRCHETYVPIGDINGFTRIPKSCCYLCPPDLWAQVTDDDAPEIKISKRTIKKDVKKSK